MNKIIACFGQLQNGKTTIVDYLSDSLNWKKVAFAKKVKEIYYNDYDYEMDKPITDEELIYILRKATFEKVMSKYNL